MVEIRKYGCVRGQLFSIPSCTIIHINNDNYSDKDK